MLTLPWRRAEPAEIEEEARPMRRVDGTWESGLRAVYERPVEWSVELPRTPGFYLMRQPGADRLHWHVIDVWEQDGELVGGWPGIPTRPVAAFAPREFCRVNEPRGGR